jgi:hypothetical protein
LSIQTKEQISNTRLKIKDDLRSTNKRISFLDEQKKKLEEKKRDLSFNELVYETLLMNWK